MTTKYHRIFLNLVVTLLITVPLFTTGCFDRGRMPKPRNMIPQSALSSILTDMYIADGLLNNPAIRKLYEHNDSTENYSDIITHHGYTKEQFDLTIEYLFLQNPKKMKLLYESVLTNLSKLDAENQKALEKERSAVNKNYYAGKNNYSLPNDGVTSKVELNIPIDVPGLYVVKARILLYEDDQSDNPHISLWFWYDDGTAEGYIEPWDTIFLKKTGRSDLFTLEKEMNDPLITHLKGYLFNHTNKSGHWEKHAEISNISVTYILNDRIIPRDREEMEILK